MTLEQYKTWVICRLHNNYTAHATCPDYLRSLSLIDFYSIVLKEDILYLLDLYIAHCVTNSMSCVVTGLQKYYRNFCNSYINIDQELALNLYKSIIVYEEQGKDAWEQYMNTVFNISISNNTSTISIF